MTNPKRIPVPLLLILVCLPVVVLAGRAEDEYFDLYGEEMPAVPEPPARQEQQVVLPPYPDTGRAVAVDLDLGRLPYQALVDPDSLSVDGDGVVRYTLLLRSASGVTNVFYEGLRCNTGQYRRYAYGIDGRWRRFPDGGWRFLRRSGAGRVEFSLAWDFLCPLPARDKVTGLRQRLRQPNPKTDFSDQE